MAYTLTIAGVTKSILSGWTITEVLNGIDTFDFEVLSQYVAYRPAMDAEVIFQDAGTTIFGGYIDKPNERGDLDVNNAYIITRISAVGYRALPSRRLVTATIAAGNLKAALTTLVTYLSSYGVTLDGAQVNGPSLNQLTYEDRRLDDILTELATVTGYVWEIDFNKVLRMYLPGSVSAPFSLTLASQKAIGDVIVDQGSRENYANRLIVRAGHDTKNIDQAFVATGAETSWTTDLPATVDWPIFVLNASPVPIGPYEPGVGASLWAYQWDPDTHTIYQRSGDTAATVGTTLQLFYTAQYPFRVTVEDTVEQTAHGIWDDVIDAPDAFTKAAATDIGTGYLAQVKFSPKTVRYQTRDSGVHPGQSQTITLTERDLSGSHLITEVQTRLEGTEDPSVVRTVTAVSGSVYPGSWRDVFKDWSGSGTGSAAAPVVAGTDARIEGDVVANRDSDGTGNVYEASLRGTASRGSAAGPSVRLAPLSNSNGWDIFADMLTGAGNGIALYWKNGVSSNFALRLGQYPSGGAHDYVLHHTSASATLKLGAVTSMGLGGLGQSIDAIYTKDLDVSNGLTERNRSAKMGEWTAVAFSAGNFTANASMTWTVASGDQAVYRYTMFGKTMVLTFNIQTTTVGGTPSTELRIAIPGGFTVAQPAVAGALYVNDNGTITSGLAITVASAAYVGLYRSGITNWAASTDNTAVAGTVMFEVN